LLKYINLSETSLIGPPLWPKNCLKSCCWGYLLDFDTFTGGHYNKVVFLKATNEWSFTIIISDNQRERNIICLHLVAIRKFRFLLCILSTCYHCFVLCVDQYNVTGVVKMGHVGTNYILSHNRSYLSSGTEYLCSVTCSTHAMTF